MNTAGSKRVRVDHASLDEMKQRDLEGKQLLRVRRRIQESKAMMRSNIGSRVIAKDKWRAFFTSSIFLMVAGMTALFFAGVVFAVFMGKISGTIDLYAQRTASIPLLLYVEGFIIGAITMAILIILRQDEFLAIAAITINLYLDWYLGLAVVSELIAVVLLLIFCLARSPQFPWVRPRALWLWSIFFVLTIFPTMRAPNFSDGAYYYITIIFSAFVMFWLGTAIARDTKSVRRVFLFLSIFGTLIAIHTVIEHRTGVFLLKSTHYDTQQVSSRAESFLKNADSAGGFFAVMLFIPLGLFTESSSLWKKVLHLAQMGLMLLALLYTTSTGGWIAAFVGLCVFTVFVGYIRTHYVIVMPLLFLTAAILLLIFFPSQVAPQIQHAIDPQEVLLRNAVWQTGINVVRAFPLTGIGMGVDVYLVRSDPYRTFGQYEAVIHPHNSYLEFAALGGIPVLLVFMALLCYGLWKAVQNWRLSDTRGRSLLAGGIAAVLTLSFFSLSNAGWTLVPLVAIGWLLLGVTSSPFLSKNHNNETLHKNDETIVKNV